MFGRLFRLSRRGIHEPEFFGRHAGKTPEDLGKITLIFVPDKECDLDNAHLCIAQQFFAAVNADFIEVLRKADACFLFKEPGQIGFRDMQIMGQLLKRQFVHVIAAGVFNGLADQIRIAGVNVIKNIPAEMLNHFIAPGTQHLDTVDPVQLSDQIQIQAEDFFKRGTAFNGSA